MIPVEPELRAKIEGHRINSRDVNTVVLGVSGFKGLRLVQLMASDKNAPKIAVVSYRDKDCWYLQIEEFCKENNIMFCHRKDFDFASSPLMVFLVGWQHLVRDPSPNIVVIHDSNLPGFQGWCPTVNSLIAGRNQLDITAFSPTEEMDRGPWLYKDSVEVSDKIVIFDALVQIAEMCKRAITDIVSNPIKLSDRSNPPDDSFIPLPSFSPWRDSQDYNINWNWSAEKIERHVRALGFPYCCARTVYVNDGGIGQMVIEKGTRCIIDGFPDLKIHNREDHVGKVISLDPMRVICGQGIFEIQSYVLPDPKNIDVRITSVRTRLT